MTNRPSEITGTPSTVTPADTVARTDVVDAMRDTALHLRVTRPANAVSIASSVFETDAMVPVRLSLFASTIWSAKASRALKNPVRRIAPVLARRHTAVFLDIRFATLLRYGARLEGELGLYGGPSGVES